MRRSRGHCIAGAMLLVGGSSVLIWGGAGSRKLDIPIIKVWQHLGGGSARDSLYARSRARVVPGRWRHLRTEVLPVCACQGPQGSGEKGPRGRL
eukprot:scaffold337_cov393-Prasinococcus_capsulatus_cf.AAC.10